MGYFKNLNIKQKIAFGFIAAMFILMVDVGLFVMTMTSLNKSAQTEEEIGGLLRDAEAIKYTKGMFLLKQDRVYSENVSTKLIAMHERIQTIRSQHQSFSEVDDQLTIINNALNIFRDSFQEYVVIADQSKALEDKAVNTTNQLISNISEIQRLAYLPTSQVTQEGRLKVADKISAITKLIMTQSWNSQHILAPSALEKWRQQSTQIVEDAKNVMSLMPQNEQRVNAYHAVLLAREYKDILEQYYDFGLLQSKSEERMNSNSDTIETVCKQATESLLADMNREVRFAIIRLIILVALSLVGFVVLAYWLAEKITQRIKHMILITDRISKGDYDIHVDVEDHDELDQLGTSINAIAENLMSSEAQLLNYSRGLEEAVENRTGELQEALDSLKEAQFKIMQNEKMAEIGQLVSGIAHEINTPLGAIHSSAGNARYLLNHILDRIVDSSANMNAFERRMFSDFIALSESSFLVVSTREERVLKKKLLSEVELLEIDQADEVAECLVDMGIYSTEGIEESLKLPHVLELLEMVRKISTLKKSIETIDVSAVRASKVVKALKSFSHIDASGFMREENLISSLETTLTLYYSRLKGNVEVERDFGKLPLVECSVDEINQVWMNLISNALQAMRDHGKLRISAKYDGVKVIFAFEDTGVGIPDEIEDQIFEPFFTTKKSGEGTGIGLDITKKIIEKHRGKIWFTSKPGNTVFYVELPVRQKK